MKGAAAIAALALAIGFLSTGARATELPRAPDDTAFPPTDMASVLLGRDLFFDPILSGNRNISCATCHHHAFGSSDGRALPLGEGGEGLGPDRHAGSGMDAPRVIPRSAPPLFNLGAHEITTIFHDGRLRRDPDAHNGIRMPNGLTLDQPLAPVAAQAMLPPVAADEMAGQPGENEVADAVAANRIEGPDGAWQILADRVAAIPSYHDRFAEKLGHDAPIRMSDIAAAIGDFITFEFRATESRFDVFLRGDIGALDMTEQFGLALFYGKAGCHSCHSGPLLTDQGFHALGMPQTGPGKGHGANGITDLGRGAVTGDSGDHYRFRTPSLRNVALTAPYGHSGSYANLGDVIRHHADPAAGLATFLPAETDPAMRDDDEALTIFAAISLRPTALSEVEVAALVDFLQSLTDETPVNGRLGPPEAVPSGLPVEIPGTSRQSALSKPVARP